MKISKLHISTSHIKHFLKVKEMVNRCLDNFAPNKLLTFLITEKIQGHSTEKAS